MAQEFGLHPLAVEDAIKAHQRPKIERYDGTLFVVLRSARYIDETETVDFGEIHVFVGEDFVVTVRHGKASTLDRAQAAGIHARVAAPWPRGDPVCGHGPGGRRLRSGGGVFRET